MRRAEEATNWQVFNSMKEGTGINVTSASSFEDIEWAARSEPFHLQFGLEHRTCVFACGWCVAPGKTNNTLAFEEITGGQQSAARSGEGIQHQYYFLIAFIRRHTHPRKPRKAKVLLGREWCALGSGGTGAVAPTPHKRPSDERGF